MSPSESRLPKAFGIALVVVSVNGRIRPDWVVVNGGEARHLEWAGGRKKNPSFHSGRTDHRDGPPSAERGPTQRKEHVLMSCLRMECPSRYRNQAVREEVNQIFGGKNGKLRI